MPMVKEFSEQIFRRTGMRLVVFGVAPKADKSGLDIFEYAICLGIVYNHTNRLKAGRKRRHWRKWPTVPGG